MKCSCCYIREATLGDKCVICDGERRSGGEESGSEIWKSILLIIILGILGALCSG